MRFHRERPALLTVSNAIGVRDIVEAATFIVESRNKLLSMDGIRRPQWTATMRLLCLSRVQLIVRMLL